MLVSEGVCMFWRMLECACVDVCMGGCVYVNACDSVGVCCCGHGMSCTCISVRACVRVLVSL